MSSIAAFPEEFALRSSQQDICWLEQREVDVPADDDWLSAREAGCLTRLRFAKRRSDWRLGRWTAKRAVAARLNLPFDYSALTAIEICATSSGSPEVLVSGQRASVAISLSHSSGVAICALAIRKTTEGETSLGCDVDVVELHSDAFLADYFTANEQALVRQTPAEKRSLLITMLWSAKESALKALQEGLRLDTRSVEISVGSAFQQQQYKTSSASSCPVLFNPVEPWYPLEVRHESTAAFKGWWRHDDHLVRTVVSRPPSRAPIHITEVGTLQF